MTLDVQTYSGPIYVVTYTTKKKNSSLSGYGNYLHIKIERLQDPSQDYEYLNNAFTNKTSVGVGFHI